MFFKKSSPERSGRKVGCAFPVSVLRDLEPSTGTGTSRAAPGVSVSKFSRRTGSGMIMIMIMISTHTSNGAGAGDGATHVYTEVYASLCTTGVQWSV